MSSITEKKGKPTINKENKIETYYIFRKGLESSTFNKKAKARRKHDKFCAKNRKVKKN